MRFFSSLRTFVCLSVFVIWATKGEAVSPPVPEVELGSPAAPLQGIDWVTTPPASTEWGKIGKLTIVEFWATWCAPCRISIPHLTEIQQKYAAQGVTVVGLSHENKDVVTRFVAEQGERMQYAVGIDSRGRLYRSYMQAFGVKGIPHAFIVSADGRILWHGHPTFLVQPLEEILSGRYDLEKARLADRIQRMPAKLQQILLTGNEQEREKALTKIEELARLSTNDPNSLSQLARVLEMTAPTNLQMSKRYVEVAHQIYQRSPRLPTVVQAYARILHFDGRTTEAAQLQATISDSRTKSLVRPFMPHPSTKQERMTSSPRQ